MRTVTMRTITLLSLMALFIASAGVAQAYDHEVWKSGSLYYWKTFGVTRGSSTDLVTAIHGCISTGNRTIYISTGGTLSKRVVIQPATVIQCRGNTFTKGHSDYAWRGIATNNCAIYDMTMTGGSNIGIRFSRSSNIRLVNIKIYGGGIGIRVDSHETYPWNYWISNVYVQDCRFENCGGHGLETYGVDGFQGWGLVARNCTECGVCLNMTKNGTVGTVDAYNCCYLGGYAGFRACNTCSYITVNYVKAELCGRGIFILSGSNNVTVKNCYIKDCVDYWGTGRGIWLENVVNCKVLAGYCNTGVTCTGSGSYVNVSQ